MPIFVVSGGRNYHKEKTVFNKLDKFHNRYNCELLVEGEAEGLDSLAKKWAESRNIKIAKCPADWKDLTVKGAVIKNGKYGPYNVLAGIQRNQRMIDEYKPEIAVIFPGGSGTEDMAKRCLEANKKGIIKKIITVYKKGSNREISTRKSKI